MPAERGVLYWEIKVAHVHYRIRTLLPNYRGRTISWMRSSSHSACTYIPVIETPFSCQSAIRLYEAVLTTYLIIRYV